jgi:putative membrane protein insertion efficiency factor
LKPNTSTASNGAFAGTDSRGDHLGLAARILIALVAAYKLLISPYFTGSCRFLPSCSDYASEAVARHGALRGSWLAARRLARCHPLCEGGHDPVPTASAQRTGLAGLASRLLRTAR